MATQTDSTTLQAEAREASSSRATRRLRREGRIPGVLYGRERDNLAFSVDALELRHALAARGAVLELAVDGQTTNAVVKDAQKHPVRGDITHLDLLRVDINKPIEAVVSITLIGGEDAPGVIGGGVLEQPTREVTVEALPTDIPETIELDVSGLEVGDSIMLDALKAPAGITLVTDDSASEQALATVTPPRLEAELDALDEALETETEVVGEETGDDASADETDGAQGDTPTASGDGA